MLCQVSRIRFALLLLGKQKYSLIVVTTTFLVFQQVLTASAAMYEQYISADLASKQAHVKFVLNDPTIRPDELLRYIGAAPEVMVASRFSSVLLDGRVSANSKLSFDNTCKKGGARWFNGKYHLVAIEKTLPNVIPLDDIAFYTAGIFRTRVTDLEFAYQWLNDDTLALPNNALRRSFYPPVSQGAFLSNQNSCAKMLASINDYKDVPILYVGFDLFDSWAPRDDVLERGVMIRLHDSLSAREWTYKWVKENPALVEGWTISTWLDSYARQKAIFELVEIMAIGAASLTLVTTLLVIVLLFARLKVDRREAFRLAYISGFDFRIPVLQVILIGLLVLHLIFACISPLLSELAAEHIFGFNEFESSLALYPLFVSAFLFSLVTVFSFVGKVKL